MLKKITLLAVTTAIGMVPATQAFAGNEYDAATLRGNGASGVAVVVTESLNCFGGPNNPIGFGNGTTGAVVDHVYSPAKVTTGNPFYDCGPWSVQDAVNGQYISTGSSAGKNNWKNFNAVGGITTNPFGSWSNIHYAWSESPINAADITTYNASAKPTAGNPIQLPLMVFSVGFSYMPAYGKIMTATGVEELTLNLKYPRTTANLGGLRMKKTTYCGIVNGTITNWNDPALKVDNGNQSLMDPQDDVTRWNTVGVPIKLVGRQEGSGTTNVFTRAMTAQCGGDFTAGGTDLLPAARLGGAVYDKATGALTSGSEVSGKFGVANGNDGVANTVSRDIPDPTTLGQVTLGGYMGYNGADWLAPTVLPNGKMLHSAQLQQGLTTAYKSPVATDATLAFKGILPPQSDSKGKYSLTPATGSLPGLRSDPLAWVIPANASGAGSLANPNLGYPIVGTGNVLIYTCYANADVRNALQGYLSTLIGKVTIPDNQVDGAPTKVPAKLITSTSKDAGGNLIGLLANNGIAPMPAQWANAINETFLTKVTSGANPSTLNLYIQDKLQKKSTDVITANPGCTAGVGA